MAKKNLLTEGILNNILNEDFWNPGKYFLILQDMEDIDGDKWNEASQEERNEMVRPYLQRFWNKYKNEMTQDDIDALFDDMEDSNWHTPLRVLIDIINEDRNKATKNINEDANPENAEKNKIISQALDSPESYKQNKKELNKMGIKGDTKPYWLGKRFKDPVNLYDKETGRQLAAYKTYDKETKKYPRKITAVGTNMDNPHFTKNKADSNGFDYYNYLKKPQNEYQAQVDDAAWEKENAKENLEYYTKKSKEGWSNFDKKHEVLNARDRAKELEVNNRYNYFPDYDDKPKGLAPDEENLNRRVRGYLKLKPEREEAKERYNSDKSDIRYAKDEMKYAKDRLNKAQKDSVKSKAELDKINKEMRKLHSKNYKGNMEEAVNPENIEKNKLISKALSGVGNFEKHKDELKKLGITGFANDLDHDGYVELKGKSGKTLSSRRYKNYNGWDNTSTRKVYPEGTSKYWKNSDLAFEKDAKDDVYDYYNFLTKPKNEYQIQANMSKHWHGDESYNTTSSLDLPPDTGNLNRRTRKYKELKDKIDDRKRSSEGFKDDLKKAKEEVREYTSWINDNNKEISAAKKEIKKLHNKNYKGNIEEAFNPENEDKNKIIRQALKGPKSYNKNLKDLQKMGINKGQKEMDDEYYGSTIYLNGPNGKNLSVDPDGTNVWHTYGDSTRKHYKKELSYKNRHSDYYTKYDTMDFNSDKAKSFDYYNYLTKPANEYQDEVDNANKAKTYRDNEDKTGYNLPDEALTPEEKSLNKRPRKYVQLNKDKEELEDELAGYDEVKSKLDKTNKEIKKLHNKKFK